MTDDASTDGPQSEPEASTTAEVEETSVENVNDTVLDTPTVNAYVVGVTISEGGGDPQAADEPAEG